MKNASKTIAITISKIGNFKRSKKTKKVFYSESEAVCYLIDKYGMDKIWSIWNNQTLIKKNGNLFLFDEERTDYIVSYVKSINDLVEA